MGEPGGLPSMESQSRTRLKRLSSSSSGPCVHSGLMAARRDLLWFSGRVTTWQAVSGEPTFLSLPHSIPPRSAPSAFPCSAHPPSSLALPRSILPAPVTELLMSLGRGGWDEFRVPIGDTRPVREPQPHPPIWKPSAMTFLGLQISPVSWKPPEILVFLLQSFGSLDQVKVSCPTGPLGLGQGKLPSYHYGSHFIKSTKPLPPRQRCCQT